MASNMINNMDNDSLRNMLKTTGMDIDENQLNMMRNMFKNPEMLKNCTNMVKNNPDLANQMQNQQSGVRNNTGSY